MQNFNGLSGILRMWKKVSQEWEMRNSWIKRQYEQVFIVKSGTVSSHLLLYSSLILFSSSHWPTLTRQQVVSGREPIFSGQLVLLLHELYHWRPLNKDLLVALGVSEEKKKKLVRLYDIVLVQCTSVSYTKRTTTQL